MATKLGLNPEFIESDWRTGADAKAIEAKLREDKDHKIKAVCGPAQRDLDRLRFASGSEIRKAIDAAGHPALLLVDTISSLASTDYRHDEWGVDVTVGGAQKGLMLPPGVSFNAVSDKALAASKTSKLPKSFWSWEEMIATNKNGYLPLYAGDEHAVRARRGDRHAARGRPRQCLRAPRPAGGSDAAGGARVGAGNLCREPKQYSSTITAILLPEGHNADRFRETALEHFNIPTAWGSARSRASFPHRPSRRHQRRNDSRRAGGDGNEPGARRHSAQEGRRAGGDGLSRGRGGKTRADGRGIVSCPAAMRAVTGRRRSATRTRSSTC
jgi:alanine-glyoxylate transaminase / serine-glyoxylate transaminase / serine-pyruvate transaminase